MCREQKTIYRTVTVGLKCSAPIPEGMSNGEFERMIINLVTAHGKFNFHGQIKVKDR